MYRNNLNVENMYRILVCFMIFRKHEKYTINLKEKHKKWVLTIFIKIKNHRELIIHFQIRILDYCSTFPHLFLYYTYVGKKKT